MEKKKWPWKRKSSERSPGESENSGSASSHSERDSDEQESSKESPSQDVQSPEVSSNAGMNSEDVNGSIRSLTEKLSAALVNVSAKDELVKQHSKVAEEAVAGWEKAENEVAALSQKLEAATRQNSVLEDRVNHLDGALKECVRQLRQAREEQEQKICEAVAEKTQEFEIAKTELDGRLLQLQGQLEAAKSEPPPPCSHPDLTLKLESLERENAALKRELLAQSEELELRTLERDLSTHAAETASKQHLESIKKVTKLEAERRRLRAMSYKSNNDNRSNVASSMYVDSLTDSQSDSGERLNALDMEVRKVNGLEQNKGELGSSDSWASALIAELDQFKNDKSVSKNFPTSTSAELDLMEDFLEMERLASLPEPKDEIQQNEPEPAKDNESGALESSLRVEIEALTQKTVEGEEKLVKMNEEKTELEAEIRRLKEVESSLKSELEAVSRHKVEAQERLEETEAEKRVIGAALDEVRDNFEASQTRLRLIETRLEELQKELEIANESKQHVESQIITMDAEARTKSSKIESLEADVIKERALSAKLKERCQELEEELSRKEQEVQQNVSTRHEPKIKQEDLAVAAGKLADCQKTIASLGRQLESLATLEEFLTDAASIPGISVSGSSSGQGVGKWRLHSNGTFSPRNSEAMKMAAVESPGTLLKKAEVNSSTSASPMHGSSEKNRNGFSKFFTRSKNGIQLEI